MLLPALIQCFDDALRRFGVVELSGLQVTANFLEPRTRSCTGDLVSMLDWLNTTLKAAEYAVLYEQRSRPSVADPERADPAGLGSAKIGRGPTPSKCELYVHLAC